MLDIKFVFKFKFDITILWKIKNNFKKEIVGKVQ